MNAPRFFRPAVPMLLIALLAGMACSSSGDDGAASDTPAGSATPAATPTVDVAGVPELADGVLTVGVDLAFPPMAFYEDGTQAPAGLEIDLMNAIAEHLGVQAEFQPVADTETAVVDEKAGQYDAVIASITMTSEHQAEIDLVPYLGPVGIGILVQVGNPQNILRIAELCGHSVAVRDIPNHHFYLQDIGGDFCQDQPIDVRSFPDYASGAEQVQLGAVDAQLAEDPVVAYEVAQSNGQLARAITGFDSQTYGIGVRKESPQLSAAVEQAFNAIRDNGAYARVLADWSQEHFAYTR